MSTVILSKDLSYFTCNTYHIDVESDSKQEFYTCTDTKTTPGAELQVFCFPLENIKELIKYMRNLFEILEINKYLIFEKNLHPEKQSRSFSSRL